MTQQTITFRFLGVFTVSAGARQVRIKAARSRVKKLIGLLVLTDEAYTDAALIDHIWADNPADAADSDLTNLVYLARQTLAKVDPDTKFILRRKGRYFWNPEIHMTSDLQTVDRLWREYRHARAISDKKTATQACREIVALYDGALEETFDHESWVLPLSRHYNAIYLSAAANLCETLTADGRKESAEECLEIALKSARYGEAMRFYEYYFAALKTLDRPKVIVRAYKKISKSYAEETGEPLSDAIKRIYNWADADKTARRSDLDKIVAALREPTVDGEIKHAYYCDRQIFLTMAHFVMRSALRDGKTVVVLIVTLDDRPNETDREERMVALEDGIRHTLRKDDVFTRLSASQYIVLPFDCDPDRVGAVVSRLTDKLGALGIAITALNLTADAYEVL